jgi:hypothetical protein
VFGATASSHGPLDIHFARKHRTLVESATVSVSTGS